jgi:hypothetical protein
MSTQTQETTGNETRGLDQEVDGRSVRSWIVIGLVIAAITLGIGTWWTYGLDRGTSMQDGAGMAAGETADGEMAADGEADGAMDEGGMGAGEMVSPDAPRLPAVFAYHDGEGIAFVHPEVSDPEIADVLGGMMGSPVIVVEALADVPAQARSTVYVFTNGLVPSDTPAGPLGFQPDVFDSVPGDATYSPLREIVMVTWQDEADARLLTTTDEVEAAGADGLVTLERSGVVVNAPVLTWPGGSR